jgi:hypothetical protein
VVIIPKLEAKTRRKVFTAIYRAAFDVAPVLRVRGSIKEDDDLRSDLIARLDEERIAALVFEDAQSFEPDVLEAIRDVMAISQDFAKERLTNTPNGTKVRALGIGVLLVGTEELQVNLAEMRDRHWIITRHAGGVAKDDVPKVFAAMLPAFASAAKTMGLKAWKSFLKAHVARGRSVPISQVEDIIRVYVRRTLVEQPDLQYLSQIPWDEELFREVVADLRQYTLPVRKAS